MFLPHSVFSVTVLAVLTNLIYRNPDLASRKWYCEVDMSKYISLLIDTLNHDETISNLLNPVNKIKALVDKLENK